MSAMTFERLPMERLAGKFPTATRIDGFLIGKHVSVLGLFDNEKECLDIPGLPRFSVQGDLRPAFEEPDLGPLFHGNGTAEAILKAALEGRDSALREKIEFDSESAAFFVHTDSEEAAHKFMDLVSDLIIERHEEATK